MKIEEQNKALAKKLSWICLFMFSFAFAMAPLYNAFCKATGFNGSTSTRVEKDIFKDVDLSRKINLSFDSNTHPSVSGKFYSSMKKTRLYPGEITTLYYTMENHLETPVLVRAIPSVTPVVGAKHIKKLECFCFSTQRLEPKQKVVFPLKILIDPDLPHYVNNLTLSYTLFDITKQGSA